MDLTARRTSLRAATAASPRGSRALSRSLSPARPLREPYPLLSILWCLGVDPPVLCSNPGDPVGVRVGLCIVYVRCSLVHNVINSTQQAPHTRSTQYRTPLRGRAEKVRAPGEGPVEMVEIVEMVEMVEIGGGVTGFI